MLSYLFSSQGPSSSVCVSSSSSTASSFSIPHFETLSEAPRYAVIDDILRYDDLYDVLGFEPSLPFDTQALRRAYLHRSRFCHPDKFPEYNLRATLAFKKVSAAYELLSKPSTRRAYDARKPGAPHNLFSTAPDGHAEATLNGVLYSVWCDFVEGDFDTLRTFLRAVRQISPVVSLEDDKIEALVQSLRPLRDLLLGCQTYIRVIRFELCRLVEIQHSLRQLSYFDIFGRTRLSLELLRVTLSLPMAIDQALQEEYEMERRRCSSALDEVQSQGRRSILGPKLKILIRRVILVLEASERLLSR